MHIQKENLQGNWIKYKLTNTNGLSVSFLNFGGIITEMITPDRNGTFGNIVLAYKDMELYKSNPHYLGAIIGPVAGRIRDASFQIEGVAYNLDANEGQHHLHGGKNGLHQVIWDVEIFQSSHSVGARLSHYQRAVDSFYPGNVFYCITYTLSTSNEFTIDYYARPDQKTPIALTNHSYFNLNPQQHSISNHELQINAGRYLSLDDDMIPTGSQMTVANSPFDFRSGEFITEAINSKHEQTRLVGNGLDHYFLFDSDGHTAQLLCNKSGRSLKITTTHPGMTVYSGNALDATIQYTNGRGMRYFGICLETQEHPFGLFDHTLPRVIVSADETYERTTTFTFSVI